MFSKNLKFNAALTALVFSPSVAFAHTGVGATSGMMHGFMHPLSGLDHMLAMVMVGLFAFQLGGRAVWLLPATFMVLMAGGGALGAAGVSLPFVETGIALSVLVLGAVVALRIQAPVAAALGTVGLFALFHGHAHGAEMPDNVGGFQYALGFIAATAVLHGGGVLAGYGLACMGGARGMMAIRSIGAVAAIAGVGLLAGVI